MSPVAIILQNLHTMKIPSESPSLIQSPLLSVGDLLVSSGEETG